MLTLSYFAQSIGLVPARVRNVSAYGEQAVPVFRSLRLLSRNVWRVSRAAVVPLVLFAGAGLPAAYAQTDVVQQESAGETVPTFDRLIGEGKQFLKQQNFEAARKSFEGALAIHPQSPEALYQMGVALISGNHYAEGLRYIEQSVEQVPNNLALRLILADVYDKGGLTEKAAKELQSILDAAPGTPPASEAEIRLTLLTSKQLISQGHPETSLEMLSGQVKRYPAEPRLMNYFGIALMVANRLDEAEKVFEALLELQPNDAPAHLNIALVYGSLNQMERAVPHLTRVMELAPGTGLADKAAARLGMYRGKQALDSGGYEEALKQFRDVVAIDPGNLLAYLGIATIHHQSGNTADAEALYRQILDASPDQLDARLRLGRLYAETNRPDKAIAEFEAIAKHGGDQPQVQQAHEVLVGLLVSTANGYVADGKIDEGIVLYEKVVQYDPDSPEGHRRLGLLLQSRFRLDDARQQFEEMARIQPLEVEPHFMLGKTLDALNRLDEAQLEYSRALALAQDEARIKEIVTTLRLARARELLSKDKMDEGRREVEGLLGDDPQNSAGLFFLALIQSQQGEPDGAVATYRTLLEHQPDHLRARLNLALLLERQNRDEEAIAEYRTIIQSGAEGQPMIDQAMDRLTGVEQRQRGATYSMGYSIAYDGNSNLSDTVPTQELRTDLNVNFAYHFKTRDNIRYRFSVSPNYAQFHDGHFDFLTMSYSGFATVLGQGNSWGGGYTHQTRLNLLAQQRGSTSDDLSLTGSLSLNKRELRARASLSTQNPVTPSVFDSTTFSLGASLDQLIWDQNALTLDYDFTDNQNSLDLGRDYAYREHTGAVTLEHRFGGRVSGDVRYSLSLRNFKNADTFSELTTKRKNVTHAIRFNTNYRYTNDMSFFGNYTYTVNTSNLPVGLIFNSLDLQEVIGPQSSSLGDYTRGYFSVGMSLRF
ncbi:MAG: TPR repeats containing protein [Gammaproteobacteria bacterium]|nr:MAG: TPR repeats containing protein [Gammaproteobacteria bacterium]TND06368.1 MAG: TPR repeats containing protein [Gammaproteobacteria bacterium]